MRGPLTRSISIVALLAMVTLVFGSDGGSASASHAGGMDAMSIDMDPAETSANTAVSLGTRELGARVDENDILDFDEDLTDSIEIDITAEGIPASNPLSAFSVELQYGSPPAPELCVVKVDYIMIQNVVILGDVVPPPDCDGALVVGASEFDLTSHDGDGALARIRLETQPGVQAGVYPVTLNNAVHFDPSAVGYSPDNVNNATICINATCDDLDGDGIFSPFDNCPQTANPGQEDVDSDGVGDVCDNCPVVPNADQSDADGDSNGDACDTSDTDGDALTDNVEYFCKAPADDGALRPERVDGPFAGVDDDGDTQVDEPLPPGAETYDCDGDGFTGAVEQHVYEGLTDRDQDACGTDGWPAELSSTGGSENKLTLSDLTAFFFPAPSPFGTSEGDPGWDPRYDLNGDGMISLSDLTTLLFGPPAYPPMFGGERAFNGPPCRGRGRGSVDSVSWAVHSANRGAFAFT